MKGRAAMIALGACLLLALPAMAQQDETFMPKGGKSQLLALLGTPPDVDALREIATAKRSEAEWREVLAPRKGAMGDQELATLAAYLAVNMPLPAGALEQAQAKGDLATALPPDGRELAWYNCQSCHSLFSGYLTQERDLKAWQNEFLTPFHREIRMSGQERETFCRYSAINMPMKIEDVPPELRF